MERDQLRKIATNAGIFCLLLVTTIVLVRCGANSGPAAGVGSANVTISDPPSCTNQFQHVYVTITGVMAHTSASAPPNAAGWQNLTAQLKLSTPVQLDLLNLNKSGNQQTFQCLLKQLGSTQSLPVGSYQQIRLILAANGSSGGGASLTSNPCTATGTNGGDLPSGTVDCVETASTGSQPDTWYPLELSSQDLTGLKIPPGQIMGGPIDVAPGKTVDININFNTCQSLVYDPANTAYRLDPTLTASQVSQNTSGISGTVVAGTVTGGTLDSKTNTLSNPTITPEGAIRDATVYLELPNTGLTDGQNGGLNVDTIYDTAVTDANGNFDFCPVNPETGGLDVVADAPATTSGTTAGATIIEGVPNGTKLSDFTQVNGPNLSVPIVTQGGQYNYPGEFTVTPTVTTASSGVGTSFSVDLDFFPIQFTPGTSPYEFVVPPLDGTTGTSMTWQCPGTDSTGCNVQSPASGQASIVVPANAPLVGNFTTGGKINWTSAPSFTSSASTGDYVVEADGMVGNDASSSTSPTCTTTFSTPKSTVTANSSSTLTSSATVNIAVSGCK